MSENGASLLNYHLISLPRSANNRWLLSVHRRSPFGRKLMHVVRATRLSSIVDHPADSHLSVPIDRRKFHSNMGRPEISYLAISGQAGTCFLQLSFVILRFTNHKFISKINSDEYQGWPAPAPVHAISIRSRSGVLFVILVVFEYFLVPLFSLGTRRLFPCFCSFRLENQVREAISSLVCPHVLY